MTRLRMLASASAMALALMSAPQRVSAQLWVFDSYNYVENVLAAARALEQINNQIRSLQNEAQMLINQARNLANLPYSALQQIEQSIQQTQRLLAQARRIAFDVQQIDQAFGTIYAPAASSQSEQTLITNAQTRWQNAISSLQDALRIQASAVGNLDTARTQTSALIGASQAATGALQVSQAGNQLLGLQTQQLADLTATVAAQGRAQALELAQRLSAQDQAREQLRRFLTPGTGYQPSTVRMFH